MDLERETKGESAQTRRPADAMSNPDVAGEMQERKVEDLPAGLRVLVVDDDPLCLMIVEKMLRRCNYTGASRRAKEPEPTHEDLNTNVPLRREFEAWKTHDACERTKNERRVRGRRVERAADAPVRVCGCRETLPLPSTKRNR